jgi:hypothetical protein
MQVDANDRRDAPILYGRALVFVTWIVLIGWKLTKVPGIDMDEAWSIVSARGEWPPADPFSGMTRYAGPFPVLLLEWLGTKHGLGVLRGTGMLCNGLALLTLFGILGKLHPLRILRVWAWALVATVPVWLIYTRQGVEFAMFGPLLALLGLYLLLVGSRWAAFGAGVCWGLLGYNHPIGGFAIASLAASYVLVYRRLPSLPWAFLIAGLALGFAPRIFALFAYDVPIDGTAAGYRLDRGLLDLIYLPGALWDTLNGRTLYLGYVGHEVVPVMPYWLVALCFFWPWRGRLAELPRAARVTAYACLMMAVLGTVLTPSLAVRYLLYPCMGLSVLLVQLGATAIEEDARFTRLVRAAAGVIVAANLFYMTFDFYVPWARADLSIGYYKLGNRNKRESNRGWLPKKNLVRALVQRKPSQVLSSPSIDRPLRALLHGTNMRVSTPEEADATLAATLFVTYYEAPVPPRRCLKIGSGERCFGHPIDVDKQYLVYR